MRKPVLNLHCWAACDDAPDGCPQVCLQLFGHDGPCVPERDDQIAIGFTDWLDRQLKSDDLPAEVGEWP